ncbi:Uncharacterised protein [uncultured archaeon]|nr:Uncharacterised protein [uncultured archaeon]
MRIAQKLLVTIALLVMVLSVCASLSPVLATTTLFSDNFDDGLNASTWYNEFATVSTTEAHSAPNSIKMGGDDNRGAINFNYPDYGIDYNKTDLCITAFVYFANGDTWGWLSDEGDSTWDFLRIGLTTTADDYRTIAYTLENASNAITIQSRFDGPFTIIGTDDFSSFGQWLNITTYVHFNDTSGYITSFVNNALLGNATGLNLSAFSNLHQLRFINLMSTDMGDFGTSPTIYADDVSVYQQDAPTASTPTPTPTPTSHSGPVVGSSGTHHSTTNTVAPTVAPTSNLPLPLWLIIGMVGAVVVVLLAAVLIKKS